jgi:EAL and modified HD-GYP domain-containing signal transduction protein
MSVLAAGPPIFDRAGQVFAYQLLLRPDSSAPVRAGPRDTIPLREFAAPADGRPTFIRFTRDALLAGLPALLPTDSVIVGIPEQIGADQDVFDACERLRQRGCRLALAGFLSSDRPSGLLRLADFVKVDFRAAGARTRELLARILARRGVQVIATGVETEGDFREARELGYDGFQGGLFAGPGALDATSTRPPRPR